MAIKHLTLFFITLSLAACSSYSPIKDGDLAEIFGSYAVVSIDGIKPDNPYSVKVPGGSHKVEVYYETYSWTYQCLFEFELISGRRYEVVAHNKKYPLTIYRWARNKWLWSRRLEAIEATDCVEERRITPT